MLKVKPTVPLRCFIGETEKIGLMKKLIYIICILLTGMWVSCSSEESSSLNSNVPFYQSLDVEYYVSKNKTKASANFNKYNALGDNIQLTGISSIKFNNDKPNYVNIAPFFYTYSFNGLDDITFRFTRNRNEVYINTVSIKDIEPIDFPAGFNDIDVNKKVDFRWIGSPVGKKEEVQIRIVTAEGEYNFYDDTVGDDFIRLTLPKSVDKGDVTVSLTRIRKMALKEAESAGGEIKVSYISDKDIRLR